MAACWPLADLLVTEFQAHSMGSLYRKIVVKLSSAIVFLVHRQNLKGFERCSVSNFEIDKPVPWIHPDSKGNRRFKVMWVLRGLKIFPNMLDQRHCLHTKQKSWSCTDLQLHFPFHSFSHLSSGKFFFSDALCPEICLWMSVMQDRYLCLLGEIQKLEQCVTIAISNYFYGFY